VEEIRDSYTYVPEDQPERLAELIADFTITTDTITRNEQEAGRDGSD
jgi:hypothetical protein